MLQKLKRGVSRHLSRLYALVVCTLLAFVGLVGSGTLSPAYGAVDVGANPTPKVDIAVALPADYPGTFLEFKQELTQKLIDQGMDPSSFRITDTAAKIDTSNTEGWLVYNHNTGSANIASYFDPAQGKLTNTNCVAFSSHIYNYTNEGKTSMVFAGYPNISAFDGMIYPAPSNARRTFSFDVNGSAVKTHTLNSTGFMMNVGKNADGTLSGYYLRLTGTSDAISNAAIYQFSNFNPTNNSVLGGTQVGSATQATNLGTVNKARFTVDLRETSVTVQKQNYDAAGNLGAIETLFGGAIPLVANGYNGFGPYMQNSSHNCQVFTQFSFLDLEMNYDSSAFDALKTTQYYEAAQQKYFINLVGASNDPQIPDETDETFSDGINRMNENEIFYLSNAQDGKIVRDTTEDPDGTVHQGLGANNGYIAMGDDYVTELAEYIYTSFIEGKKFDTAPVASPIPLANFYMVDASTKKSDSPTQIMTIHQRHLLNTNSTFSVNIADKSKIGQLAGTGDDARIAQWRFRVLDPDSIQQVDTGWLDSLDKIPDYTFNGSSKNGKWIFELTVRDQLGNESKASQTYITAFLDDRVPKIEGTNTAKNIATFTFTDTGQGIDDDGITFIEDDRGSGVAAYWITNDENATPTDTDWEYLDEVVHSTSVDWPLDDTKPLVVWVKDECGNLGAKTVFQPTRVIVQDPDGNPIDDYIVIDDNPIIVLPDEKDLDDPEDPDDKFSGWTTPGGVPVTPGTTVPKNEDHTIIIRPSYAKDSSNIIYLANGGQISESNPDTSASFQVISGNSIQTKIEDHNINPVREGYSFKGWKLVAGDTNAYVDALVDREAGTSTASGSQLVDPADQVAKLYKLDESDETTPVKPENIKKNNYYLVAQWEIGDYTVHLDANGGTLGGVRSFEGVKYQQNVADLDFPVQGRTIPTKPGYIFQGWSTSKNAMDVTTNTFKVASGVSGITVSEAPTMPAHDITVYAVWKEDKDQFVVHFDSDGGSRISDQAYKTATTTTYTTFKEPTRPGYDFAGWYEVKEDGSLGSTAYKGTENVIKKSEHTFRATWAPRDDTKYTVDYYANSGTVDAAGNAVYTKVNRLDDDTNPTKTYTGTTESTVTVPDGDKVAEIATGGKSYWFNPESTRVVTAEDGTQSTVNNNVFTGAITGSPTLSLKLYYDRFFDVNVAKDASSTGDGTCEPALKQKEGTKPTVSWKAAEGSHVERVIVDGVVRDDLVSAGSYTVENPLAADVRVSVVFAKDADDNTGTTKPVPPVTEDTHFTVKTKVVGTTQQGVVDLTPTHSVKNHSNTSVIWSLPDNSRFAITSVTVDGVEVDIASGKVDFTDVSSDHEVVVTVAGLPSMGGTDVTTVDKYTLTVNRYGGDDKVETSDTMTVNEGTKVTPSWDATNSDWQIVKIMVDNVDITDSLKGNALQKKDNYRSGVFQSGFTANHVLDIYMALPEKDEGGNDVDPVIPDYTSDEYVKIKTKLVGAEGAVSGSITGGAVVKKNSDNYDVDWALTASSGDGNDLLLGKLQEGTNGLFYATSADGAAISPDDPNYVCYELEKVVVNGQEQAKTAEGKVLVPTNEDKDVEVYVRPVRHTVTIEKFGEGEVSPSKSVYHLANYKDLKAQAANGWVLAKVVANGEVLYDAVDSGDAALDPAVAQAVFKGSVFRAAPLYWRDSNVVMRRASTEAPADDASLEEGEGMPLSDEPVISEIPDTTDNSTSTSTESGSTNEDPFEDDVTGGTIVDPTAEGTESQDETKNEVTESAPTVQAPTAAPKKAAPRRAPDATTATDTFDRSEMDQTGIVSDRNIQVYFAKQATDENGDPKTDDDGKPVIDPLPEKTFSVNATIVNGEGSVEGNAMVEKGGNATITITPGSGYSIESVKEGDTVLAPNENGEISFSDVTADHNLVVTLKRNPVSQPNPPIRGDIDVTDDTTFDVTTSVQGGAGTISGAGPVAAGDNRTVSWKAADPAGPDAPQETVEYVFIDGVSHPELAGGTEGKYTFEDVDSKHHVVVVFASNPNNIDTDGDGDPDINIDKDGDGEPDINIDKDDDGDPDVDIDTDGDGEPDVNIDPDDDGTPDVNVDTDGDGEPDVNVDTDGDGEPDINIVDEDGDGKPDPVDPKDPDSPKIPTTNVDTNDDGKPDVNVDTDGDGKPDINIVDNDGDGKPDPVDPKGPDSPKTPTTNIDTDGDGKPDLNVDTDGDGIPDMNIVDKDGDGKPDPVDPESDPLPEPDRNVDTNGDGVYDWKDEGHPQHQDYLDSIKDEDPNGGSNGANGTSTNTTTSTTTTTTTRRLPFTGGGMPITGDVATVAPALGSLGALALAATGAVLLRRKRRDDD